ncbi:hypothetical protein Cgig2_011330 [Carnegiea gigantea]|uniref:Uncharacterized protein n=1 Tax=Carnegiea gigantea TaxID=171969 RepID=A0A9Q1QJ62_9CARY|nr:hypothetical protein Cgig2_011330 [Carnegiea gigantea]
MEITWANGIPALFYQQIALSPYTINISHHIPTSILNKLNTLIMNFFWQNSQEKPSIHWTKQETCGLGIQNLTKWNQELLMKQAWRIHTNPQSLLAHLYREHNASQGRMGLVKAASKFKEALRWEIRNGSTVRILEDKWCSNTKIHQWHHINLAPWEQRPVAMLFNETLTGWELSILRYLFPLKMMHSILEHPVRPTVTLDQLYWTPKPNGIYTINSGCNWLMKNSKSCRDP